MNAVASASVTRHFARPAMPAAPVRGRCYARAPVQLSRYSRRAAGGAKARSRARVVPVASQQASSDVPISRSFDFLVLGSGIAGLTYALKMAEHGSVAVVTKGKAFEGCTQYAQGGICAVLDQHDSVESHVEDTMIAGGRINSRRAVEIVCSEGPARVLELVQLGAEFTRDAAGALSLTREGGHSHRRIVHAADVTGREIERTLLAAAAASSNIQLFEHFSAVDLITSEIQGTAACLGVDALDTRAMRMTRFVAPVTMLATGGAGQAYPITTNPGVATGDGMAMAHRARAAMANMEFVQFHPTAFCAPALTGKPLDGRAFLISEAVRGEGGRLYNQAGHRFMNDYDSRLDLAPRDIVARAIHEQMQSRGESHVLLDISYQPRDKILQHFPNIAEQCAGYGLDITRDPIPVAPAQHYMCGGVKTGVFGETSIRGMFACGEVSCTGLHGANRLASNSLLEGLVFAARSVEPSLAHAEMTARSASYALTSAAQSVRYSGLRTPEVLSESAKTWVDSKRRKLTHLMRSSAGIVRRRDDMKVALQQLATLHHEIQAMYKSYGTCQELMELRNLTSVGELILMSALQRRGSCGGHYCVDDPAGAVVGEPKTTIISYAPRKQPKTSKVGGKKGGAVIGAKAPLNGGLGKGSSGLIERSRARELAVKSQQEDAE